jgi:N-acetylglutamate synthase-like GNAT family acetyltransferase
MTKQHKIEDLRWVRALMPDFIPRYLVEQVRDKKYTVDGFYKHLSNNCMIDGEINPFNHLWVLANDENIICGFLWFLIDPLTKSVLINTFSVDEKYWFSGEAIRYLIDHMKNILKKVRLGKVYWLTTYPKHSQRYGFKRSSSVLMEYTLEEESENGRYNARINNPQGGLEHADKRAAESITKHVAELGATVSTGLEPVHAA